MAGAKTVTVYSIWQVLQDYIGDSLVMRPDDMSSREGIRRNKLTRADGDRSYGARCH